MTRSSRARLMSASCSRTHGCGGPKHGEFKKKGFQKSAPQFPQCLPEGLDYVRGGRGSGVGIGLPGKGDGGAGDIGHLRSGGGTGDEVWIGGPVWLNRDSELFTLKRRNSTERKEMKLSRGFSFALAGAYRGLLSGLSTRPPRWAWRRCTHTCQCHQAGGGENMKHDARIRHK